MWNVHAHGEVLLTVGLGERGILRCKWAKEKKDLLFFLNEKTAP